tara:strand:- start:10268 stop:10675 length:408 start_codon:yes stop_codon:yes gene_type:complete
MNFYFKPSIEFFDLVINHPSVRPTAQQGTHPLSSEELLSNPENIAVAGVGGVVLFVAKGNGVYQGHIFALEASRGRQALHLGEAAIQRLKEAPGVRKLVASVPMQLPAARYYCRRLGLKPEGRDLFDEHFSMEIL